MGIIFLDEWDVDRLFLYEWDMEHLGMMFFDARFPQRQVSHFLILVVELLQFTNHLNDKEEGTG